LRAAGVFNLAASLGHFDKGSSKLRVFDVAKGLQQSQRIRLRKQRDGRPFNRFFVDLIDAFIKSADRNA
jgi:hypothetical protein